MRGLKGCSARIQVRWDGEEKLCVHCFPATEYRTERPSSKIILCASSTFLASWEDIVVIWESNWGSDCRGQLQNPDTLISLRTLNFDGWETVIKLNTFNYRISFNFTQIFFGRGSLMYYYVNVRPRRSMWGMGSSAFGVTRKHVFFISERGCCNASCLSSMAISPNGCYANGWDLDIEKRWLYVCCHCNISLVTSTI
jgi:hypothetical protein